MSFCVPHSASKSNSPLPPSESVSFDIHVDGEKLYAGVLHDVIVRFAVPEGHTGRYRRRFSRLSLDTEFDHAADQASLGPQRLKHCKSIVLGVLRYVERDRELTLSQRDRVKLDQAHQTFSATFDFEPRSTQTEDKVLRAGTHCGLTQRKQARRRDRKVAARRERLAKIVTRTLKSSTCTARHDVSAEPADRAFKKYLGAMGNWLTAKFGRKNLRDCIEVCHDAQLRPTRDNSLDQFALMARRLQEPPCHSSSAPP